MCMHYNLSYFQKELFTLIFLNFALKNRILVSQLILGPESLSFNHISPYFIMMSNSTQLNYSPMRCQFCVLKKNILLMLCFSYYLSETSN